MRFLRWESLPSEMQNEKVLPYYNTLKKRRLGRFFKRLFDIFVSLSMIILTSPILIILAIAIKIDSKGPVFYRQVRVTRYNKQFRIFKFRTMVVDADKIGAQVTLKNDSRITKIGKLIRKCRLDELPQLFNILTGDMSFVGTRPEVPKYTEKYTPEMMSTLLMPAGVTSKTSVYFKDEDELLDKSKNPDETYINEILPIKMYYNLKTIKEFGFWRDIGVLFMTVFAVLGKKYERDLEGEKSLKNTEKEEVESNIVANA